MSLSSPFKKIKNVKRKKTSKTFSNNKYKPFPTYKIKGLEINPRTYVLQADHTIFNSFKIVRERGTYLYRFLGMRVVYGNLFSFRLIPHFCVRAYP